MVMAAEDRTWLEQRLELHHRMFAAQLEDHFDKMLVALETHRPAEHTDDDLFLTPKDGRGFATPFATPKDTAELPKPEEHMTQMETGEDGKVHRQRSSRAKKKTSLHHLTVPENQMGHDLDQKSMRGRLAVFLSTFMPHFINFCVLANTIIMFVQLQWLGNTANVSLGLQSPGAWSNAEQIFQLFEYIFTTVFIVDLVLNLIAFRLQYFQSTFNIMDSIIVVITSLEVFVLTPLASSMGNVAVARLLRLAKLARAFRAARTFKSFEGLRVLVATMCFSIGSTLWSLVILLVFQLIASIFMCQSLHDFVVDPSQDPTERAWVNRMYGDGVKSFWTIFELTFSGCWPNYARRIIYEVSPWYSFFYFAYVYIVVFVATRIVAALFMKETLAQSANDAEMMVKERKKKSTWIKATLADVFETADTNNDGYLNKDEFFTFLDHKKVQLWMKELGVDVSDKSVFLQLLDDNADSLISREEFEYGITKLRGEARAQDLFIVFRQVMRTQNHVKKLSLAMNGIAQSLAVRQTLQGI